MVLIYNPKKGNINGSIKGVPSFFPSPPMGERVRVRGNAISFLSH
jgi:hypothetical protein